MSRPFSADDELVELVDPDGAVVEIVTRAEMRARIGRHRCTYIVVRSTSDQILVHQRSDWKDLWPSRWDLAFGGVVGVGEDWRTAAERELHEEAGITGVELVDHGTVTWEGAEGAVVGHLFSAISDGPFTHDDGEVVATEWVSRADLAQVVSSREWCLDSASVVLPAVLSWPR